MPLLQRLLCVSLAFFATTSALSAVAQSDLSSEPYVVFVAEDSAYARCGPAGDYYRTDPLRHGQALEVYAETDDGWLGIRPPEESFCWVIAETIELNSNGDFGTIIEDKTVAWIGTHLGRAKKYRWQVQLAKGEEITIIGRSEREGPDGPQLWYRIVPPSGEFRWVHRDQVVETSEDLVASVRKTKSTTEFLPAAPARKPSSTEARTASTQRRTQPSDDANRPSVNKIAKANDGPQSSRRNSPKPGARSILVKDSETIGSSPIGSGLKDDWKEQDQAKPVEETAKTSPARSLTEVVKQGALASIEFLTQPRMTEIGLNETPNIADTAGEDNWVAGAQPPVGASGVQVAAANLAPPIGAVPASVPPQTSPLQPVSANVPLAPAPVVVSPEQIARVQREVQGANVDQLSLILSRLMAERASAQEVQPVVQAASSLAVANVDDVTAGRARMLADRSMQYQRVAQRRGATVTPNGGAVAQANVQQAVGSPTQYLNTGVMQVSAVNDPHSSVTQEGYLVQVYSVRPNSPPFALTDNAGRTLAYVTPSPGINIRSHLNSHVRVRGTQGFLRGLNTPHILVRSASRVVQ